MKRHCLVLVDIRSTHNVGSMLRTADGFGADVILVGITPRPLGDPNDDRLPHIARRADSSIAKTAIGAEKKVAWRYFADIEAAISQLKSEKYRIAALEQTKTSQPLSVLSSDTNQLVAVVVGPEVDGLPQHVVDLCDESYEIPMQGTKESFNVSVAAAIALYQISLAKTP